MSSVPSWDHPRGPAGARLFMTVGSERGLTPQQCLAGTGLTAHALADATTFVEGGQELGVVRNLIECLGDPPGLGADAGARATIGTLGIWGFAVLTSPNLAAALDIAMRFIRLSTVLTRIERRPGRRETAIVFHDDELPIDVRDAVVERDLAVLVPLIRGLLGRLPPARLETRFVGTRADAIEQLLDRQWRLARGHPEHALHLTDRVLAMSLPQADPITRATCERECEQLLQTRERRTGTAAAVRARLLAHLGTAVTMQDVAAELHVSVRTLRRHLEEDATSFGALRDEVFRTVATELLQTVGLSVTDVAARLGYSDPTSFTRAFTRWTGMPPSKLKRASDHGFEPARSLGHDRSPVT
jgi:AraC-like DNA-binding protein